MRKMKMVVYSTRNRGKDFDAQDDRGEDDENDEECDEECDKDKDDNEGHWRSLSAFGRQTFGIRPKVPPSLSWISFASHPSRA